MLPVSSSRARNLIVYFPGSSVKPVSYSMGRLANSAAVASLSLMFTLSRTFETVVPKSSLISPMKSISVCSAPPRLASASSRARNFHHDGDEILGAIQLEVIDLHRDGELRDRVVQHQRVFELPLFIGGGELAELFAGEIALAVIEIGRQRP